MYEFERTKKHRTTYVQVRVHLHERTTTYARTDGIIRMRVSRPRIQNSIEFAVDIMQNRRFGVLSSTIALSAQQPLHYFPLFNPMRSRNHVATTCCRCSSDAVGGEIGNPPIHGVFGWRLPTANRSADKEVEHGTGNKYTNASKKFRTQQTTRIL